MNDQKNFAAYHAQCSKATILGKGTCFTNKQEVLSALNISEQSLLKDLKNFIVK